MAFAFFRRRRKLVIFVMVFLMVSFLLTLGGGGEEIKQILDQVGVWFGARDRNLMGASACGKVYVQEYEAAINDVEVFRHGRVREGIRGYFYPFIQAPDAIALMEESTTERSEAAALAWMLLLKEARKAGIDVPPADAKTYLEAILKERGAPENAYESLMADLRGQQPSVPEKGFLQAVCHWMSIDRYYRTQVPACPPLEAQQLTVFRDLTEQVNLRVRVLDPRHDAAKVGQPTGDDVQKMFDKYKDHLPGAAADGDSFGFGYRYPDRVKLRYLRIDADAVRRATLPDKKEVSEYYENHRDQFYREEPAPQTRPATAPATSPATNPATNPATDPATQPAPIRIPKEFYEAKPQIIELLRPAVTAKKVDDIVSRLSQQARLLTAAKVADPLGQLLAEQMLDPKANQAVLDKPLPPKLINSIRVMTLEAAMDALAEAAELAAICYPWGLHGQVAISPDVTVTLTCPPDKTMTLGAALDEITQQVMPKQAGPLTTRPQAPRLQWAVVRGMGDPNAYGGRALYCLASNVGLRLAPFQVGTTELLGKKDFTEDPVLHNCRSAREEGQSLAELAFASFGRKEEPLPAEASPIGKEMYVVPRYADEDEVVDRLLWQLLETSPSQSPQARTPQIDKEIVADWQLQAALEKELPALGRRLAEEAKGSDLAAAAKKLNAGATWDTGLFSRTTAVFGGQTQERMEVAGLFPRIDRMSPDRLQDAVRRARSGDMRPLASVLAPARREALEDRIRQLGEKMESRAADLPSTPEAKALQEQVKRVCLYSQMTGDLRPLFKLANQTLPDRTRLGGLELTALQAALGAFDQAIVAANDWNLDFLADRCIPEARPMYLLARLKHRDSIRKFLEAAFTPPANIEAPVADLDKPGPIVTMAFPAARIAVVFQRIGYRPPVAADFVAPALPQKPNRAKVIGWLEAQRRGEASVWWFNCKNTVERLKYKRD